MVTWFDAMLCFSGDGDYQITMRTKATVSYSGKVRWEPPAIYKAQCDIDVTYFPFDEQNCRFKLGSWSHDGDKVQEACVACGDQGTTSSTPRFTKHERSPPP